MKAMYDATSGKEESNRTIYEDEKEDLVDSNNDTQPFKRKARSFDNLYDSKERGNNKM